MPVPRDLDPFVQESVYDRYDLPESGSLAEITEHLRALSSELDALPQDERAERIADLQQELNKLKNPRLRVLINAHLIEHLDMRRVVDILSKLPGPTQDEIALPALGLSQILIEGECPEYSKDDFKQIEPAPSLELDFQLVKDYFENRPVERHIVFDS